MSYPKTSQIGSKLEFFWEKHHVYALIDRIHEHRDNRITAEITLKTDKPDSKKTHIIRTQLNLLSARNKKALVTDLVDRYPLPEATWTEIIEQLCEITLESHRKGKPPVEVWPFLDDEPIPEPQMLIRPILYKDKPTVIYGEGSAGKSLLALAFGIMTQLPYHDNHLRLQPERANVLYLDYESDEAEFKRRLSLLSRGFAIGQVCILYRQCHLPFIDDIDQLETLVVEHGIGLIIVDSLGVASGNASLNDPTTATAFYLALRRLNVTSLLITHMSKDSELKRSSAFGSVYFTNLARSVFHVVKQQEQETNVSAVDLIHTKNNQGPLLAHQGFSIRFEPDKVVISRMEPTTVPEFVERMTLKNRIIVLLKGEGKLSTKEISDLLERPENTIRAVLSKNKELFVRVGEDWAVKSRL